MELINEIGVTYSRLTVIAQCKSTRRGVWWLCKCQCGKTTEVLGVSLRNRRVQGCGCRIGFNTGPKRKKGKVLRSHYSSYRSSKRAKELGFMINYYEFERICRLDCYYCGVRPQERKGNYRSDRNGPKYDIDFLSGIDRLDNTKGYVEGNCIPCCGKCNIMKGNSTEEEFLKQITKIYKNLCNKT